METKTIYYDGLEIRLECEIEEGNRGDGYITPIESDYLYISSVIVVHDNGDESDITGIVSARTINEWQLELNQFV
jgi:hypothetical protein